MNFTEIAKTRQSCRNYDGERAVEDEKLSRILESACLSPSACNGQPYSITVCRGDIADKIGAATRGVGINKFTENVHLMLVISEEPYTAKAALGAKLKKNDYRSIDIGILAAYITAEAAAQGIGSCIIGWFNDAEIRKICGTDAPTRLVIALGYPKEDDVLREKKRKSLSELVKFT